MHGLTLSFDELAGEKERSFIEEGEHVSRRKLKEHSNLWLRKDHITILNTLFNSVLEKRFPFAYPGTPSVSQT